VRTLLLCRSGRLRLVAPEQPLEIVQFVAWAAWIPEAAPKLLKDALGALGGWRPHRVILAPRLIAALPRLAPERIRIRRITT
jgi:hypothetical protein